MKKLSKILVIAALALLCVALLPAEVNAETESIYTYTISGNKVTITDVDTAATGNITIPETLGGYPVIAIGDSAFENCTGITGITIPDSVISIGERAFYYCNSLTSVTIPENVTRIDGYAFCECDSLVTVDIPDGVVSLGDAVFQYCDSLTTVNIGSNVVKVDGNMFAGCFRLEAVHISENNSLYASDETGLVLSKDKTELFFVPQGKLKLQIPETVTVISKGAASDCDWLTVVEIPDSVTVMGSDAFVGCENLVEITLGKGITSINEYAFSGCSRLVRVKGGENLQNIGSYAFYQCSNLTAIALPDGLVGIGDCAFYGCSSLPAITIPNSVIRMGTYVFAYCSSLSSVRLGAGILSVPGGTFTECTTLETIVIPHSVLLIDDYAFSGCRNLVSIFLPKTLGTVGCKAFYDCRNIQNVYYAGSEEEWGQVAIDATTGRYYYESNYYLINATITYNHCAHTWDDGVVTKEASCIAIGELSYTCLGCGGKKTEEIPMAETHSYADGVCAVCGTNDPDFAPSTDTNEPAEEKPKGGCYIATCVYGSYDCSEVWTLRRFRDDTLASTWLGRAFVRTYYAVSPTLVDWFGETNWFRSMWRGVLDIFVDILNDFGVEDTAYEDKAW